MLIGLINQAILTQSYWRDEAFTVMQAGKNVPEIFKLIVWDSSPPLYYLLLHFWMKLFGETEIATRSLSLLFHLLSVMFVCLILKKLTKNRLTSWLGSLGVLLNPFLVAYAFETRPYSLFYFCLTAALWGYYQQKQKFTAIMLSMMVLTHNFGLFFLASFGLFLLFNKLSLKFLVAPILAWIIWLPIFFQQLTRVVDKTWIQPMGWLFLTNSLLIFSRGNFPNSYLDLASQLSLILLVVAVGYQFKHKQSLLTWLWLGPILMAAFVSKTMGPLYVERYLISAVPVLIIWLSQGLFWQKKFAINLLVCVYLIINSFGAWQLVNLTTKPDIRSAVRQVMNQVKPGEIIIADSEYNFLETKYYAQKINPMISVWLKFSQDKNKLPYYFGWPFYKDETFVKEFPVDKTVWVIKTDGSWYKKEAMVK